MRSFPIPKVFASLFVLAVAAAGAYCCGDYGDFANRSPLPASVKLPGQITTWVIRGNSFYGITANDHLVSVHLRSREVRDYGTFDMRLSPVLEVDSRHYRALVTAQNRIYHVDLNTGKIVQATICELESKTISKLTMVDPERICVQHPAGLTIVNLATGKAVCKREQPEAGKPSHSQLVACDAACQRFYALTSDKKAATKCELCVTDVDQDKVIDRIAAPNVDWHSFGGGDLQIVGDKAYLLCLGSGFAGWGQWNRYYYVSSFGVVDLKTSRYQALKLPASIGLGDQDFGFGTKSAGALRMVPGHGGTMLLVGRDGAFQYDAEGKLQGAVLAGNASHVLGVWQNQAIAAGNSTLEFINLQQPDLNVKK